MHSLFLVLTRSNVPPKYHKLKLGEHDPDLSHNSAGSLDTTSLSNPVNLILHSLQFYYPSLVEQIPVFDEVGYSAVLIQSAQQLGQQVRHGKFEGKGSPHFELTNSCQRLKEMIEVDKNNLWGGFGGDEFLCLAVAWAGRRTQPSAPRGWSSQASFNIKETPPYVP